MMPMTDTQQVLSGAHITAVLWTPDSGWLDTTDRNPRTTVITAEEKLARLAEALEALPELAAQVVEMADHVAGILDNADLIADSDPFCPITNKALEATEWIS